MKLLLKKNKHNECFNIEQGCEGESYYHFNHMYDKFGRIQPSLLKNCSMGEKSQRYELSVLPHILPFKGGHNKGPDDSSSFTASLPPCHIYNIFTFFLSILSNILRENSNPSLSITTN